MGDKTTSYKLQLNQNNRQKYRWRSSQKYSGGRHRITDGETTSWLHRWLEEWEGISGAKNDGTDGDVHNRVSGYCESTRNGSRILTDSLSPVHTLRNQVRSASSGVKNEIVAEASSLLSMGYQVNIVCIAAHWGYQANGETDVAAKRHHTGMGTTEGKSIIKNHIKNICGKTVCREDHTSNTVQTKHKHSNQVSKKNT